MTRRIRIFTFLIFAIQLSGCVASPHDGPTPLHLWNHKLTVPMDHVTKIALGPESLHVNYAGDSNMSIMMMSFDALSLPAGMTGPEFIGQVYGIQEPELELLASTRKVIFDDVVQNRVLEPGKGIKVYWLDYEGRASAYIVDEESDDAFLLVEGDKRSLERIVNSITRR